MDYLSFFIALGYFIAIGNSEEQPKARVYRIEPHEGSYQGATRLSIFGEGFSSSGNLGTPGENPQLGNEAFLVSDYETVPCIVEVDASHETMIICYTGRMIQNRFYYIMIIVDGQKIEMKGNCYGNYRGHDCRFVARWYRTPLIDVVSTHEDGVQHSMQVALGPGRLITACGRTFTKIFGSHNQFNENGRTVRIRRIYVGGHSCEVLRNPDEPYGLHLTAGDEGCVTCNVTSSFIGYQNFSYILDQDFGRSDTSKDVSKISGKDRIYHLETYAEITRISPQVGSIEGGTRVYIEGRNFDDTTEPVQVAIGGVPCHVIPGTLTLTTVECIAGSPPPKKDYYTGSRGVTVDIWNNTFASNEDVRTLNSSHPNYDRQTVIDSTAFMWNDDKDIFSAKYTGVFVTPKNDRYKFMIAGDDRASLYINCTGDKNNLVSFNFNLGFGCLNLALTTVQTKVAYVDRPISSYYYEFQKSEWFTLIEGQECYLEAVMTEYRGLGYMYVGVHRATTTLTAAQSNDVKNEVQYIDFKAKKEYETQVLDLTKWSSQTGKVEVQEIIVQHSCIDDGKCQVGFRLDYDGIRTTIIEADATQSAVRNALKDISQLKDEGISVSRTKSTGQVTYTVKFTEKRGDYSTLRYVKHPADAQGLSVTIREVTKGVSEQKTFKINLGGRSTPPISENFNEEAIRSALDATRQAYCPGFLLPDPRDSSVVATIDYESAKCGTEWGSRVQDIEPFCGNTSVRNCEYIYYAGRTADNFCKKHSPFDAVINRWLCLAHQGLMKPNFHLSGTFKSSDRTLSGSYSFPNPLVMEEGKWKYSCIDLMEVIHSQHPFEQVYEATISVIRFLRYDKYHKFYVDAITIGSNKVTQDLEGVIGLRTPPALADGKPLKSIAVKRLDGKNAFEIKIDVHSCGHLLPLVSISFVSPIAYDVERTESGTAPMGGTFDISVKTSSGVYNVTGIPVDITSENLRDRLQVEVPNIGDMKISRHGSCHAVDLRMEWISNGGDKPQVEVHIEKVTGASDISASVKTLQNGGVQHSAITGDMARRAYDDPQTEVKINGGPAKCVGSCQFITSESATPNITAISPSSGSSFAGTVITITGANLNTVGATTSTVRIGESDCTVVTNTATSITCNVGDGPLGTYDVSVNVGGKGLARKTPSGGSIVFTILGVMSSISPSSGFNTGGTEVTLTGYGFSKNTVFSFQSSPCEITSLSTTKATCIVPAFEGTGSATVSADDEDTNLGLLSFNYITSTATLNSISPTSTTLNGGANLTLSGTNIGQPGAVVYIGTKICKTLVSSASEIICSLPSAPVGNYDVKVKYDGGYANEIKSIRYILEVNSVSPTTGSINGGTKVTITGNGFTDADTMMVTFGKSNCIISSVTSTMIECTTSRVSKVYTVRNNGTHPSEGPGFAWSSLTLGIQLGDTVQWKWEFPNNAVGGWEMGARVFTALTSLCDKYDEAGFESAPVKSKTGTFSYTFAKVGTYFICSGNVDNSEWGSIAMKQSVVVAPAKSKANQLKVTIAGYEAIYNTGGGSGRRKRSACSGVISIVPGCTPANETTDPDTFSIVSDPCYSSEVTSISPLEGNAGTTITIKGKGFSSSSCANKVTIAAGYSGEYDCAITSSTSTTIKCKPTPTMYTQINVAYYVKVYVDNIGDASIAIKEDKARRFMLFPRVSSISPNKGSLSGGTLITIQGSGFSTDIALVYVTVGGYSCDIQSTSYFEIQCLAPSSEEGLKDVSVTISGQSANCTGNCQFSYESSSTPIITSVNPTSVSSPDTEITLEGTGISGNESKVHVTIGTKTCVVTSSTSTKIKCNIDELPAGSHALMVSITGKGKATLDGPPTSILSSAHISGISPVNGSLEGGTVVTITGNGFKTEDLQVKIGSTCEIDMDSLTNFLIKCKTPKQSSRYRDVIVTATRSGFSPILQFRYHKELTPEILTVSPSQGGAGDTITATGSRFDPSSMKINFGNAECVNVTGNDTVVSCQLQEHPGGEYEVSAVVDPLGIARSSLKFNYSFAIMNAAPSSGSFAGGDLISISGKGFGSRAVVTVCNSTCEHANNETGASASYSQIVCRLSGLPGDTSSDKTCDITVTVDGQSTTGVELYTFAADKTPKITSISPERGGTQGGTNVTITGTLFDPDSAKVSVEIGGVRCDVTSSTATEIKCTTNARGASLKAGVSVTIDGKGLALNDGIEFYYVDVWSSRWTWGGLDPPVAGDFVVVPTGQTLVIDVDTPILKMILIQGGIVIFDEKDIHLQTENILITDGGVLQVGTEEKPFEHKAIFTLHGHLRSLELPIYGTKTIGVRNGTLDLHGKHIPVTWTHLGETAVAGSNVLTLKEPVTWKAGDEIVIASTGHRHSQRENEKRTILSVAADKTKLTLTEALNYTHISVIDPHEGVTLEARAEVGLLTRNIVVQGSTHMEWTRDKIPACPDGFDTGEFKTQTCFQGRFGEEEGSDQFGAQIMIHHSRPGLNIARARIEFVELTNVGQAFRIGRYPIHFHLLGDVDSKNYVKGCAIHKSFNRAITIHNTHHLIVERNVVFDIMGGAVFIEDGIEHGNKIRYNLVVFAKQSTSLQNDDITPAAFWVTNPNNTIEHNAAAGGTHFGFWYRIHKTPDGPSADPNICQQLHPVESFRNNTVHSQEWFGLWMFETYTPRGDGSCGSIEPTIAHYHSLVAWNCEKGAEFVNAGAIQCHNFIMANNEKAGIETKLIVDKKVKWGQAGTYDSFIIAHSPGLTEGESTAVGMILPWDEGYEVNNTKFINFDQSRTVAIGVTSIDGTCSVLCGGWESRFAQTSFENSPNKAKFRWEHEIILRDLDGTLSGTGRHSVITPFNPTVSSSQCSDIAGFDVGDVKGVICDGSTKFHRVSWNNVLPTSLEGKNVSFTTESGSSFVKFAKKRLTHKFGWMGTMMDGETYRWDFEDAGHLTNISYSAGFYSFGENDCIIVSHNLTQKPDKFIIAGDNEDYAQSDMVSCASNFHGDYYFDAAVKVLYYIVSGRDRVSRKKRAFVEDSATPGERHRGVNFKVYRCYYPSCEPPPDPNSQPPVRKRPDTYQLFHVNDHWNKSQGEYVGGVEGDGVTTTPPDNQDVRIESGAWMVVEKKLPKMNKLWIEGVLEITPDDPNLDVTLSATHIIIMGGRLIIGWEDSLFMGMARIILRGDHNTPDILLDGGVNLGAKAIGVIGGLDLHGKERSLRTTHLASSLLANQNMITVVDEPSDWAAGDEIVIATTSADPWETETFKITSVSGNQVTLNASAKFDHIAETFSHSFGGPGPTTYDIRAEVSMLTRNIKVIGEDYSGLYTQSFGARVLVAGAGGARGYARIENVEFYHTGQEGWIDNYDPRYSLAFLNTGQVDVIKPSDMKRNTFHNGFNTAIGVFGASELTVSENTIHHTVGPGIRVEGTNISLEKNLVMLSRTRSVYQDRMEDDIMLWKAAIEVNLAKSPVLKDNVVVGSERAGYRIDGHNCDPASGSAMIKEWGWNTARATLHGVWMNKDGFSKCSHISKFKIHSAYDDGIYFQGSGNLKISNVLVTDSGFGISPIIYSPPSLSHVFEDKSVVIENSTLVAVSKSGYCPTLPSTTDFLLNSGNARGMLREGAERLARTGILWPIFISSQNAAPSKPFVGSMSYPAIGGKTIVKGVTFVNFDDTSCTPHNTAIMTNVKVEDFLHPIIVSGLKFVNTAEKNKIFFHRPTVGAINPSDCVDMECDGMKKALILDKDGSLIGGAGGSVIPQAEFEWNGDRRRGLGDYRIPKTLLTRVNGSRIPVNNIAPYKGILRANTSSTTCVPMHDWQAHMCQGYHHGILVIENLDADTETRRLSPVALLADKYIDLNNGTCPQKLRLRILNERSDTKMVLKILYKRPQRLDVYTDGTYTLPLNGRWENKKIITVPFTTASEHHPAVNGTIGDNFFDRDEQLIHVTIGGDSVVEIHEAPVVVITFNMPAVTPDEFFDNGRLVSNLALFLNIPESKIRFVKAVREGSARRRKRSTGSFSATVEIGDPPAQTIQSSGSGTETTPSPGTGTTPTTDASLSSEELANVTARITNSLQDNTLGDALGTNVTSLAVVDARSPITRNANITNSTEPEGVTTNYFIPSGLKIVEQPSNGFANNTLSPALQVAGVDGSGNEIVLGHSADPWQATVSIVSSTDVSATLSEFTAYFDTDSTKPYAIFTNLTMSAVGDYMLRVQVTHPMSQSGLTIDTSTITISLLVETTENTSAITTGIPISPMNKVIIIACSVAGGALLIALIVVIVLKAPCFRPSQTYKLAPISKSEEAKNVYSELPPSPYAMKSTVNINNEAYEGSPRRSAVDVKGMDNPAATPKKP